MRSADCVPGSVATTLTISTGAGTRRSGGWMNESKATCSRPPEGLAHASSSDLIQRRAAPMPCVSESVRDSVWRVWNEASLRMRASMRAGWMALTIASICGFFCCAAQGSAVAIRGRSDARAALILMRARRLRAERARAMGLGPQPPVECIEVSVDHGHHDEREERGGDHAADDRAAHRRLLLGAFAEAERERQHAEDHRGGGHQDRPQAD